MADARMEAATTYDLTRTLTPYLDRHMVLRLVEFLEEHKLYPHEDLLQAKLDVIDKTRMADLKLAQHKMAFELAQKRGDKDAEERYETAKKKCQEEKSTIPSTYKKYAKLATPLVEKFIESGLGQSGVDPDKIDDFKKDHMIDEESLKSLYSFARLAFDIGRYSEALDSLSVYRILSSDEETVFLSMWGKLAAEILLIEDDAEHIAEVIGDINHLRDSIDRRLHIPHLQQLTQRAWLINWSLFPFMASADQSAAFVKFLLQEKVLNAVQIRCPYILRYLVVSLMCSYDQSKIHIKQVMDLLDMERDNYRDPLTEFVRNLMIDYDFEEADIQLVECEKVFDTDFFLNKPSIRQRFFDKSRHLMFEFYCRIHKRIDISILAKRLNLDEKDTDKALVDLLRNAPFEGKINSKTNQLVVSTSYPSVYQKVIDKTKGLAHRTQTIADAINKRMQIKMNQHDS